MKTLLYIVLLFWSLSGWTQKSTFNDLSVDVKNTQDFTFLVGGHFHGASTNVSGFPAATVLGNLDEINAKDASFMVCLGDLFLSLEKSKKNYERVFFSKLNMPLFNAVGNHDIEEDNYTKFYGKRYFSFSIGNSAFVILDTEEENGDFEGEQLSMLKQILNKDFRNVFVFAHRPVWAEYHEELEDVFKGNTSSGSNYGEALYPLFKQSKSHVYMFGGSLGGEAPVSFFYHQQKDNITYIATAIRNLPRDGILQVSVKNGEVSFGPISLTGQSLKNLEAYNLSFWDNNEPDNGFNWRLLPLYTMQMLSGWHFWIGVLLTLMGGGVILWWIRRRKRRKA